MKNTKQGIVSAVLALSMGLSLSSAIATGTTRPTSVDIYQNLERLWSRRSYAELDRYVGELQQKWKDYAPVELTLAIYSYRYGEQIEDSIRILTKLRERMGPDIETTSPLFLDLLDGRIYRYQRALDFEAKHGISRERRLAERHPLKKTTFTFPDHWVGVDDMLYYNVPEVFASDHVIVPASAGTEREPVAELQRLDYRQLLALIDASETPMDLRKAAARELVGRRAAGGSPGEVLQGLFEGRSGYTGNDTADALVAMGAAAVPTILKKLDDPLVFDRLGKTHAIWALVRIGVLDQEVSETLQHISTNTMWRAYADYARRALRKLEEKNAGNIHRDAAPLTHETNRHASISGVSIATSNGVGRPDKIDDDITQLIASVDVYRGQHNRGRLFRKAAAEAADTTIEQSRTVLFVAVAILVAATVFFILWRRR